MRESGDSLHARVKDSAELAPNARALSTFGRVWPYAEMVERMDRLSDALDRLGVGPGRRLGLLIPPVPTGAMALLAAFRLGAEVVPINPMYRDEELLARLDALQDGVLLTLDLTRLQDRWVSVFPELALEAVLVEKMSELLPFPRNLLMPMMRGGEIASIPRNDRTAALPGILKTASVERDWPETPPASLRAAGGASYAEAAVLAAIDALLAIAGGAGRWMLAHHLESPWAMAALAAPLTAGREAIVLPRLDRVTVARAVEKERPQIAVLSTGVAEALADAPPEPGALDLAVLPSAAGEDLQHRLQAAAGCRVALWPGPEEAG